MNSDKISEKILKILTERKKMFGKTFEMIEGFCFVIFITYLCRPDNTMMTVMSVTTEELKLTNVNDVKQKKTTTTVVLVLVIVIVVYLSMPYSNIWCEM
jgi:hypothetical protein